jgi:hypothetical protein
MPESFVPGSVFTLIFVPRAAVLPRPLQQRQVPVLSGLYACQLTPTAVVLPHPLQHRQLPAHCSPRAVTPPHGLFQPFNVPETT